MADPKAGATTHRYLFVVEVEKLNDEPLPKNADTAEVIKAGLEATGLCETEGRPWRVSHMEHV